jgi:hypothetical protein
MDEFSALPRCLLLAGKITKRTLAEAPCHQGAYVLWLESEQPHCLKVGIAGPRKGHGIRGRLKLHFSSNLRNSVLARHLAADASSARDHDFDFRSRTGRQDFLARRCYFQAIALTEFSRQRLLDFEAFLVSELKPRYLGRVKP